MKREYIYIGSSPAEESCAQVGADNYFELSRLELAAFKQAIIAKLGEPPEGASFGIKDRELVCYYDLGNEKARDYAFKCESESPVTWAEVGMKAPRLDDPEFTKSELIEVPNPVTTRYIDPPTECDMHKYAHPLTPCQSDGVIHNEFFDATTKMGSWANMCPACFGAHGRGELGIGKGQHYKKATDGNFYKVEG